MSEPGIISNYIRAEPISKPATRWWYLFPAVVLPLCMGVFVAGEEVFFFPAGLLQLPVDATSDSHRQTVRTIALILAAASVLVMGTKRAPKLLGSLGVYFLGFFFWGSVFLISSRAYHDLVNGSIEAIFYSAVFGVGTLLAIIGPATLIVGLIAWSIRSNLAGAEKLPPAIEPVSGLGSLPTNSSEQQYYVEAREQG